VSFLHNLVPDQRAQSLLDIDPAALAAAGVRGLVLDIDNTIAAWDSTEVRPDIREWLQCAKRHLSVCLLSNSSKTRRLKTLQETLGIPVVQTFPLGKPRRKAYLLALAKTGTAPQETVMIGDQLFTDIFGANRAGLRSILVAPLGDNEFIGTKVTRLVEALALWMLKRRGLTGERPPGARCSNG
jgi:HAD superfamily phosphatase (TIGR01668 family)